MIDAREPAALGGELISRCLPGPRQWAEQGALRELVRSLGDIGATLTGLSSVFTVPK